MARARSLAERQYVLKADRDLPENEQTIFWLRPLKNHEKARMLDSSARGLVKGGTRDEERRYSYNLNAIDVVATALVRVERFVDADDQVRDFAFNGKVPADFLDKLELKDIGELFSEVIGGTEMTEDEEKNSERPSGSRTMSNGRPAETRIAGDSASAS